MFQHTWEACNNSEVVRPCRNHKYDRSYYDDEGNRLSPNITCFACGETDTHNRDKDNRHICH